MTDAQQTTVTVSRDALMDVIAHLVAAASAYEKYARRYRVRGPSDPFFGTRLRDFQKASERAQALAREVYANHG